MLTRLEPHVCRRALELEFPLPWQVCNGIIFLLSTSPYPFLHNRCSPVICPILRQTELVCGACAGTIQVAAPLQCSVYS